MGYYCSLRLQARKALQTQKTAYEQNPGAVRDNRAEIIGYCRSIALKPRRSASASPGEENKVLKKHINIWTSISAFLHPDSVHFL